jgi:ribosome-associated protein YbcJ (S4-like RNA binding protein)
VAIDIQIYQTIERFVLENYKPEKRKKRKLVKGMISPNNSNVV